MKNYLIMLLGLLFFLSCDPYGSGEGINLPEMKFGFKVSSDSTYIKVGDTVIISASIPNPLINGVEITDGKATINFTINYTSQVPIEIFGFIGAKTNEYIYTYIYIYIYIYIHPLEMLIFLQKDWLEMFMPYQQVIALK